MNPVNWALDRHVRHFIARLGLPDLPEVRKLMRLSWWNGFTFGALERKVNAAYIDAFRAIALAVERDTPGMDRDYFLSTLDAMRHADDAP